MADTAQPVWVQAVVILGAVAAYTWRATVTWDSVVDDSYISARYAEHLAEGYGLVYNVGEPPIEGITNLAFTVLLAIGRLLGLHMHTLLPGLGWVFGVLAVVLAAPLVDAMVGRRTLVALAAPWMIGLSPHLAVASTNGLESSMMVAMVMAATWSHLALEGKARWVAMAWSWALIWTRPEGVAVVFLLVLHELWRHRRAWRDAVPYAGSALAAVVVIELFRLGYYGDYVPNTFRAKSSFELTKTFTVNAGYLKPETTVLLTALAGGVAGMAMPPWRSQRVVVFVLAAVLGAIPLTVNLWMPGLRLFLPGMALAACLLVSGLAWFRPWLGTLLGLLLVSGMGYHHYDSGKRVRHYDWRHTVLPGNGTELAALHLRAHAPEGAWLATRDAGVFAYYVGTGIRVAELHQRALTLPHPGGANADTKSITPINPEFFASTQRRDHSKDFIYNNDRAIVKRFSEEYDVLGRVYQHYHRYYDIYARADLQIPPLPGTVVVNMNPPAVGPSARKAADEAATPDDDDAPHADGD